MQLFLTALAALTLVVWVCAGIQVTLGGRRLAHLDQIEPVLDSAAPRISVVIPACNEARQVEHALASVLAQDYPDFEVIAVDDRSTDATGSILDRIAQTASRLRVVHVRELPPAWLGKNNALQSGASQATGAVLLFTDADVVMQASVLRRAAAYLIENRIDHLAIAPHATVSGFLPNAFLTLFALLFSLHTRPWKVRDPKSRAHIGIGAFNMVRASAYWAVGGHAPIAMRPDDDVKLGKLLKQRGYAQDLVFGTRLMTVNWYGSLREMRDGLMKNLFAGVGYSVSAVVLGSIAQLAFLTWPFIALFATTGLAQILNLGVVVTLCVLFGVNAGAAGIRWWWCFTIPIAAVFSVYLFMRSMLLALKNRGIDWRGTRYPLEQLRRNRI